MIDIDNIEGTKEINGEEFVLILEDKMERMNPFRRVPLAAAVYLFASKRFYKKEAHKILINPMHTIKLMNQAESVNLLEKYLLSLP